ncbi:MAG: tRNA (adenosine(37)-N6)-dimethylallyltransferase MiaA [Candidatus Acetothermia bacterium]|nr:tRNA (adenosine(37)-N6)-dimethylallyltransferase MiaA [Candidatus Acetothermia bacterium]MDH7505220.1 tRNA (adenosine(37)-N6)-dimethylallyltransferase MiaA [Candidatus Acetothermia bacterium]
MRAAKEIPLIFGPTGVGKTEVALGLAQRLGGEIISADSRGFYRGLEIGTAKPTAEQRRLVPHHLLDIRSPEERYDVAEFRRDVARLIGEIRARGRWPIVVGGSTLYMQALVGGLFPGPQADLALRRRLLARPLEELYIRLREVDPRSAEKINPQDRQRLVRALEVYELTGRPLSELQAQSEPFPHSFIKIGLVMDRKRLYKRLDARVEAMLAQGLIEEARQLKRQVNPEMPAYRTIGYEEAFAYLEGALSLEEAVRLIKRNTRRLAKRQLTFFKRIPEAHWIDVTAKAAAEVVQEVLALLGERAEVSA